MKLDIWVLVVVLGVVILLAILYALDQKKQKKERDDILANSLAITNPGSPGSAGTVNNLMAVRPYTDKLYTDFNAYSADTYLYDELMTLDNEAIRNIWLDWDQRYRAETGKTLSLALYDAYSFTRCCSFGWDWTYHAKPFHDKLKSMGLP